MSKTKYLLVEVKKPFGYYRIGTKITMRESLVKGDFKDKVEVVREATKKDETKVEVEIEENKTEEANKVFFKMVDNRTLEQLEAFINNIEEAVNTEEPIDKELCKKYIKKVYKERKKNK